MNKQEFLAALRKGLSGLPEEEIESRANFYGEMIDDRVEDGLTEEAAIQGIGSVEDVVAQITAETPLAKLVKERVKPKRRLKGWETALLIIGSPVWVPILIALFAVAFSLLIVLWSLVICLYAIAVSFAASAVWAIVSGIVQITTGSAASGWLNIGSGLLLAGLAILMVFACIAATKGVIRLTKKVIFGIKSMLMGKESAK